MDNTPVMDEKGHEEKPKTHDIVLEHVDFSYEKRQILKDINIHMKDKTMTAIIGPSGSGKTTICNLIVRFWDVDNGKISIGGTDIRIIHLNPLWIKLVWFFKMCISFMIPLKTTFVLVIQRQQDRRLLRRQRKLAYMILLCHFHGIMIQ